MADFGLWGLVGLIFPLLLIAICAFVLYWIVRRAVRDGITDAHEWERRNPGQLPPGSQPRGPQPPDAAG